MNALTIDLVPGGEIRFESSETGIEILYKETERHKVKSLGAIKTDSFLYLNGFFGNCLAIAIEKSKPPEPNWMEFLPMLRDMFESIGKMNKPDEESEE